MTSSRKLPFHPPLARLAWGVVAAVGVPLMAVTLISMVGLGFGAGLLVMTYAGVYACGATAVFGLPAVWLMRGRSPSVATTGLIGACVASAPCAIHAIFSGPGVLALLILTIPLGCFGGMIFGAVALARPPPPPMP